MEASERQAKEDWKKRQQELNNNHNIGLASSSVECSVGAPEEEEEEDQFDLNRIISGMATLSGPCGTYAIRESTGLAVVRADPRDHHAGEEKKEGATEEEPHALDEGQTVQVVQFEDGVAKLARDEGFIVANTSQLVKGT